MLPSLVGGGAERVSINLLLQLHDRGYLVELVLLNDYGPLDSMLPAGLAVHNLRRESLRKAIYFLVLKIREINPRVVFSTHGHVNLALLFFRPLFFADAKIWIREANIPSKSLPNNPYPVVMKTGYRLMYRAADRVICTSEKMKGEFAGKFNIPESKLCLLPNPVDEDFIRNSISKINRDSDSVCFVAAGRLTYQKGFDRLLYWFSKLENKKHRLHIFGSGALGMELHQQAIKLGIDSQVTIDEFSQELWSWIAGADAFLLSSRWEGMPNVVLEALTCGTPVIATDESGGIEEVAHRSLFGSVIVVPPDESFYQAMADVESSNIDCLRSSLLPECYKASSVINIVESWMADLG